MASNQSVAVEICEALGLERVKSLNLRMAVNEAVMITAEIYANEEGLDQLKTVLKRYKLVPVASGEEQ